MNIYLIRHGETDWNLQGILQGREDIPLNDTGRMQAKQSGEALKNTGVKIVVSSPLARASETAYIISDNLDEAQVIIENDLIERDFGILSGLTYDRRKYFDSFDKEDTMEPLDRLSERLIACIHKYAVKYYNQDIIMVSHGAAINSVIMALTKGEQGSGKTRLKNACISILTYENNKLGLGSFNLSPEEFKNHSYAIAIDLGTTTLALALVSIGKGNKLKGYNSVNPQRVYGSDVISRIKASNEGGLKSLSKLIREELLHGIHTLVNEEQISYNSIRQIIISGNTTMIHLLMEFSCKGLGAYPYTPVNLGLINTYTDDIFGMDRRIPIMILPSISVFVGADITAGLLACGIDQMDKPCLFIDLGTNGEIVLGNKEGMLATSTAAGPAFEGVNISCGVASIPGAICHVSIEGGKSSYKTINNEPPIGICGTGVIELVSELLKEGIIDSSGLLVDTYYEDGYPIAGMKLIQRDIRELQLAKAAIRAGVDVLLESFGISYEQLDEVYIAGGFGYHLDIDKAICIGLLPDAVNDKVKAGGNTSLSGAICTITNSKARDRIEGIISSTEEIHLSNTDKFKDLFIEYLSF